MPRWVLLRHDLPDGSSHLDWLLEPAPGASELVSFRVQVRPDDPGVTAFVAERIGAHRPLYLDYAGPVSGGRGTVSPVSRGECTILTDEAWGIEIMLSGRSFTLWRGVVDGPGSEGAVVYRFDRSGGVVD